MKWEDLQKIIDEETEIEFNEIPGRAKIVDGVAAGEPWIAFKFSSGPYAGKTLYCAELNECEEITGWQYETNADDDGFLFNWQDKTKDSQGSYVPKLNGKIFTLKK